MKTYLLFLSLFFCIACTVQLEAQNVLKLATRHTLLGDNIPSYTLDGTKDSFFEFHGVALSFQRDRIINKFYEFGVGFNYAQKNIDGNENTTTEVFIDTNLKIFRDLINKEKVQSFFSLRPRLFYVFNEYLSDFPRTATAFGIEVPLVINVEYFISPKIRVYSSINLINISLGFDEQYVDDPAIPVNQRVNSGFDLDVSVITELRLGVGYVLNKKG